MAVFKTGFKKADLQFVLEELGVPVPEGSTLAKLKHLILDSEEFKQDPEFVKGFLETTVEDRKKLEEDTAQERNKRLEIENQMEKSPMEHQMELARMAHELELLKVQAGMATNSSNNSSVSDNTMNPKRKFTLPKLQFRQFGDDIKEWLPFWSQFKHIDNDEDIALEDKFQYLIQSTVIGSRAREIVESFPPTGDNYDKAVDSLKTRFGSEDLLVEVYVRELLKLIINVQINQAFTLTSLYDKLETYLRALDTLGVTTDKCASVLYPMVESCFPEATFQKITSPAPWRVSRRR